MEDSLDASSIDEFRSFMKMNASTVKNLTNVKTVTTYVNGDIYDGHWQNSQKNGFGKYSAINGITYEGNFKNALMDGVGKLIYEDRIIYEGSFKDNHMHGQGVITLNEHYEGRYYYISLFIELDIIIITSVSKIVCIMEKDPSRRQTIRLT